ncbi:MAG: restriction endonuclease [Arcobacter sp.]|uniref:hypothetical protein n=1 Tax=uncultured Arcobacter sp. TaxID=165434 RepID=UPI000CC5D60B|nr:hypothetical protein [uncultured Arcobacter sp.]PLY11573.1 MAG: restriction endonuclease [Arcobacter sp.]
MKLGKKLAILAIVGTTSLFASGVSDVSQLVYKINNTADVKIRAELLKELDTKLTNMDKKELPAAQEIVSNKLQLAKVLER